MPIRIAALLGTSRPGNYTGKALALVIDEFRTTYPDVQIEVLDPATMDLPFPGRAAEHDAGEAIRERVAGATGIVIATPEYHGSFSAVLKLMIENLGFPSVLRGKPVALLGVAGGRIGAIKSLEQLRSVCSHVGAIVLPAPISVAGVRGVFDEDGHCINAEVERQVRSVASTLIDYIQRAVCPKITLEEMMRQTA